jgi:short-subunit dehydrogenase
MAQQWERALVTGASSGIGRSIATQLARRGADLVVVARRRSMLEDLARGLETEHGAKVEILAADLLTDEGLEAVEARLRAPERPVDLLVNNAGFGTFGSFHKLPLGRETDEIRLNVLAPVRLAHAALGAMAERKRGGILNVSSTAGFQPMPFSSTYCSTKSFLNTFSQALHEEAKAVGVHVSALCPGYVRTEFQDVAEVSVSAIPKFAWLDVEKVAALGLAAVDHNRALAVTGGLYKFGVVLNRFLPRPTVRRMAAKGAARRFTR